MHFNWFALKNLPLALALLAVTSCASHTVTQDAPKRNPATSRRMVRKTKIRNPQVRVEIQDELGTMNANKTEVETESENQKTAFDVEPLKGPITTARLAQIELEQKIEQTQAPLAKAQVASAVSYEPGKLVVPKVEAAEPAVALKTLRSLESSKMELSLANETPFIFDIPVTYNERVSNWIHYFQTSGRRSFRTWLERSARYLPVVEAELQRAGLPQDLVYVAMIESGFKPDAVSHAGAMGMWQFISATGRRYGLSVDWWLDERRDFAKSTHAAIAYMKDLNTQFNSWYLVAASYNMGENGVRRLLKRHNTNDFWTLADRKALPRETTDYVPKIIAATLIAKAPALYGFRDLEYQAPLSFEMFTVPGGTDLVNLASFLGISGKYIQELNPELTRGFVPRDVKGHSIRIPKGSGLVVSQFVRLQQAAPFRESAQNDLQ